jgi:hypothetical protein
MLQYLPFLVCSVALLADAGPVTVTIERARGDDWQQTDPSLVFDGGDQIRFRVRSSEPGYLYILNETIRGERQWLFPTAGDPAGNRLERGRDYMVPETNAVFTVARQPGFESVYFILTTVRLPSLPSAAPAPETPPAENTLLPRCNEGSLRARGVCIDTNAGSRTVRDRRRIEQLTGSAVGKIFITELRLAHK